jgi:hypothetical protein
MADNSQNLKISERILLLRQQITALEEKETELTEQEQKLLQQNEATLAKILKFQEKRLKAALGTKEAELDVKKTISAQAADLSSISSLYDGLTSRQKESLKTTQSIAESVYDTMLADDGRKDLLDSTLQGVSRLQALQQKMAETGPEDLETQQSIRDAYRAEQYVLEKTIASKKVSLTLSDAEADALERMLKTQDGNLEVAEKYGTQSKMTKEFLEKQINVYKGINSTIRGVLNTAKVLTSTLRGGIGAALLGASVAGKKLLDTSYQLGGSLLDTSNISTTLFGTVFEDAVGTTKGLAQEFGGLNDVTLQTQLRTNVLAKNLGIGAGEAAKLTGSFARLNDGSQETAQNLIQSTKNLAEQNGLVPSQVMADVANSAEAFAAYGKEGGTNIAEAAVAAGKLGVTMSQLTGITDNLLDFESSINSELELGAMLGRNINLDRARALAYEGNIGGAVRETLSSLGGIEEFNKMDIFQKREAAKLLGLSVDEFQKMAANADKLNKDGSIQLSTYEKWNQNLKAFGSQILSAGQGLAGWVIATGQIKDGIGGIGDMWGKVKGWFSGGKDIADGAMDAFSAAKAKGLSDKQILAGFGGKEAKDMMTSKGKDLIPDASDLKDSVMPDSANPAKKGGMMDSMSKINMNAVLKGAAAMVIVAGAVFVFGKAVQEFMKVSWEAVGMAVVSMLALVGAVALLGAIMTSGVGAVAILAGAAAMLVIAASVLVLGHALQAIGTGFEMMSTGIQTLMPQLMAVATTIGGLVTLIPSIALLAYSIMGLSGSLVALGVAGLVAAPGLMALTAVGAISTGLNSLMGGDEGGEGGDSALLEEIRGLRADLNDGKVGVYMDGTKVTAAISKVVNKVGSNSYAIT